VKKQRQRDTHEQLLAQCAELQERLDAIKRDYAGGLDRDSGEQAVQLENAEVLEKLSRKALEELRAIDHKLRKLENSGPYE
jgi:RNA polymerase-binding transcription factor DksA